MVTVAWNGRREAARAVFDALPLLRLADEVDVVWLDPQQEPTLAGDLPAAEICAALDREEPGLLFANLVDFDSLYGHRNDVEGYAANLERFDALLGQVLGRLQPGDLFVVTADHGNDPTTPSTDHSREYVPLLAMTGRQQVGRSLGTRSTFADLGQTLAAYFGVGSMPHGESFLDALG